MFLWPKDELAVVNTALSATGDNQCSAADDGSDEWNTCDPAYQTAIGYISESHNWGFATLVATLQPSPTLPPDTDWDSAYPLPSDLVHMLWAKINENVGAPNTTTAQLTTYGIE